MGDLATSLLERDAALLRAYRPPSSLRVYLTVVARTTAFRILRKRQGGRLPDLSGLAAPESLDLEEGVPVGVSELEEALASQSPRDRFLLRLVYWDGLSYEKVGRILGLSPVSVGPALTRARASLRSALEKKKIKP